MPDSFNIGMIYGFKMLVHFFLFFAMKRERNEPKKEKHATAYQGSAPNPVFSLFDLIDEFTHQSKDRPCEGVSLSLPRSEKSDFSFLVTSFSFHRYERERSNINLLIQIVTGK